MLVRSIIRAVHGIADELDPTLRRHRLSLAEGVVLHLISDQESSIKEIQQAFGHRPSTLTSVVDRLETRGFVERRRNPHDRRSVLVSVTETGEEASADVAGAVHSVEAAMVRQMGGDAAETVSLALRRLAMGVAV